MTETTDRPPYWQSRRGVFHRAVEDSVQCGAGIRDMKPAQMLFGGALCAKCFPMSVSA